MKIEYLILHHSAVSRKDNQNQFDAIRKGHIAKGYGNIGYNWFIEPSGTLKEGREQDKPGAHCYGHNHDSLGICLAGNFSKEYPKTSQEVTLRKLLIQLKKIYPDAEIKHHRDFRNTQCPGNLLEEDWHKKSNNKNMRYVIDEQQEQFLLYDELKIAFNIGDEIELKKLQERGLKSQPANVSNSYIEGYDIYPLVSKKRWGGVIKDFRDLAGF